MICTWQQLRDLRATGQKPSQRVIITTDTRFAFGFDEHGAMAIVQKPGDPMPVELLDGLHVCLWLKNCDQASAVAWFCKRKGVTMASCLIRCSCYNTIDTACSPCKETHEIAQWINSLPGAA